MRAIALAVVVGAVAVLCPVVHAPGAAAAAAEPPAELVTYEPPVDAAIVDPFRPPPTPFGPGNRGVDYDTAPGDPVRAIAPGIVRFAGQVGGVLHITVEHADGRLSTYSAVGLIQVRLHEQVDRGAVIAAAGGVLHLGVREDGRYIDPEALFAAPVQVRLVPESPVVAGHGWRTPGQEAVELRLVALELSRRRGGPLSALGSMVDRIGRWAGWSVDAGHRMLQMPVDGALWFGAVTVEALAVAAPVLWYLAPYILAAHNPLLAGFVFNLVVPLLRGEIPPIVRYAVDLSQLPNRFVGRGLEWWAHRSNCTPAGVEPPAPAGQRVAVLVAGLDSTSTDASIGDLRTDELGYEPDEVIAFSYAGGRTPGRFDDSTAEVTPALADLPAQHYGRADSSTDLVHRGQLLADLLTDAAVADPTSTFDLYAHSQGGLVARLAIHELEHRPGGSEVIDRLGLVATMGTPHGGSDLAAVSVILSASVSNSAAIRTAGWLTGTTTHHRGTTIPDLARGSELLAHLADQRLPGGPSYLTLANRGDLVVTDARSRMAGSTHVTLGGTDLGAHADLPGQADTTRELALGLAGWPPTCQGLAHFLADAAIAEGAQLVMSGLGLWASKTTFPILPIDVAEPLVRW
jgi:hypothetical protein